MTFSPSLDQEIIIDGVRYSIAEHPSAPGMVYGQEGRAAVVYQLISAEGAKALKVFKPRFAVPSLVMQADKIAVYASLPGLSVCRRSVLTPSRYEDLLRQFPDLTYAVLMPWVEGRTWQEILLEKQIFSPAQSLALAKALAWILVGMEECGIAHCDISATNLIVETMGDMPVLSLVDVEGLYSSDLAKPNDLPTGSPGYAHKAGPAGLWSAEADRFAGAVMIAEMLGWSDARIIAQAYGESYFAAGEMQKDNLRLQELLQSLKVNWGEAVSSLFQRAWRSDTLDDCPAFGNWLVALPVKPMAQAVEKPDEPLLQTAGERSEAQSLVPEARLLEEQGNLAGAIVVLRQALAQCADGDGQAEEIRMLLEKLEEESQSEPDRQPEKMEAVNLLSPTQAGEGREEVSGPRLEESVGATQSVGPRGVNDQGIGVELGKPDYQQGKIPEKTSRNKGSYVWLIFFIISILGAIATIVLISSQTGLGTLLPTEEPTATIAEPTVTNIVSMPPDCTEIGQTRVSPVDGMELVCVPAGEFTMGLENNPIALDHEMPQHMVYLDAYWIDRTEVTNEQFAAFVEETGYQTDAEKKGSSKVLESQWNSVAGAYWAAPEGPGSVWKEGYPVVHVSWNDARAYCRWMGRDLPSEAQWEKAARGTDGRIYPWGDESPTCHLANYLDCGGRLNAVGSLPEGASPYGALDMAGNVLEWTEDWFGEDYYSVSPKDNPQGPEIGNVRVLRSGSLNFKDTDVRTTERRMDDSSLSDGQVGFRCAVQP